MASSYFALTPGDPAPQFFQRCCGNPKFAFDSMAGRYIVLCFYASAADPRSRQAIDSVLENRHTFDDRLASFFGISLDPRDESQHRVSDQLPGIRFVWDFDTSVSRLYGALPQVINKGDAPRARRFWMVIGPTLRVMAIFPFAADGSDASEVFEFVRKLPPPDRFCGFDVAAPILVLPQVFEPAFAVI